MALIFLSKIANHNKTIKKMNSTTNKITTSKDKEEEKL